MGNANIAENIRKARLLKGYSQENVADMLGISTTAYGDIERNKTALTIQRANDLAKILDLPLQTLLADTVTLPAITTVIEPPVLDNELIRLQNENEQLQEKVFKLQLEANYWREKFEERVLIEAYRMLKHQQREPIGF
ncbi:helix-turn-helix domain-containing protein [Flectobacillus major]|uniref:helix-turn-helix domain-containing protein n=1 Tax=Flectobacillus major TaxID=103 RepID=UPI000411EA8B|nr:helix-turn-helix domain-containing protein [Flectobacillus major]